MSSTSHRKVTIKPPCKREALTVRVHCCEGRPPVEFIRLSPTQGSSDSQRVSEQVTRPQGGTSTWCVRHEGGGRQERERNSNSTPSCSPSASSLPPATRGFREIAISRNHELAITGWDLLDCEVGHRLHTGARPRNRYNERCNALNVPTGRCACVVLSVHRCVRVCALMRVFVPELGVCVLLVLLEARANWYQVATIFKTVDFKKKKK